uniref:CCHC-type domain-containing protein n=1 Tax=Tanacetum cinerariifolium TaxID=118510 RepID=A0A6L2JXK4_TANCI|nr:hypothetical protein [Tanacetum cinerariifolium]
MSEALIGLPIERDLNFTSKKNDLNTLNFFDNQWTNDLDDGERDNRDGGCINFSSANPAVDSASADTVPTVAPNASTSSKSTNTSENANTNNEDRTVDGQYVRSSNKNFFMPHKFDDYVIDGKVKYGINTIANYSNLSVENFSCITSHNKSVEPRNVKEAVLDPKRNTLVEYMILFGADNHPPMLDKELLRFYCFGISSGDDSIACLNKAMVFLTDVASSRVTVQQVQGRQWQNYSGTTYKGNSMSSKGNTTSRQERVVKCYNYQGEGHMARQCTQPKRQRNDAWYKEKAMLAEAQEARQILDEEQLAFLEDP